MIADLGYFSLLTAFLLALYGCATAVYGVVRKQQRWVASARAATLLTFPLLTLSSLTLIYSLVNLDFQIEYVAQVTSRSMPTYLRATALWGGQAGSLLFWAWLMSVFTSAVMLRE